MSFNHLNITVADVDNDECGFDELWTQSSDSLISRTHMFRYLELISSKTTYLINEIRN